MGWSRTKVAGLAFLLVFVVLQSAIWDSPDIDVFGVSVPAWLVGLVCYLLGAGAGWAAERSRTSEG